MKKLGILCLLACLVVPATASAEGTGIYVAPRFILGVQNGDIESNNALGNYSTDYQRAVAGGAFAVGYSFASMLQLPIRAELEYSGFESVSRNFNTGTVSGKSEIWLQSLFANLYYDFENASDITPYLTAGAGVSFVRTSADTNAAGLIPSASFGEHTRTNFAWNGGAGIGFELSEMVALDLGYRFAYFGKGHTKVGQDSTGATFVDGGRVRSRDNYMHQIVMGARFTF